MECIINGDVSSFREQPKSDVIKGTNSIRRPVDESTFASYSTAQPNRLPIMVIFDSMFMTNRTGLRNKWHANEMENEFNRNSWETNESYVKKK